MVEHNQPVNAGNPNSTGNDSLLQAAAPAVTGGGTTPATRRGGDLEQPNDQGGMMPTAGAPPSDTAPANCISPQTPTPTPSSHPFFHLLRYGIDSLYLSYPGTLSQEWDKLDELVRAKKAEGVANATINRTLALVRSILRRAMHEWEWLDSMPKVRLLPEPKRRIRFLTEEEAERLLAELPEHLAAMVRFSLETGLRQSNVTGLLWSQVDLVRKVAWIHPDQAKARKAIAIPLSDMAVLVIRGQLGKHDTHVFSYRGKPVQHVNNHAWDKALVRAGIENFRWHDLRHTWASWHVQRGTPLHVLQELGGWESVEMVRRYAHLSGEHLSAYAQNLTGKVRPVATIQLRSDNKKG
jgi:integrase